MSTFRLEKEFRFEAAHRLPLHDGKCQRLHGHSWRGTLVCEGYELVRSGPKSGMLIDFSDMKQPLNELLADILDHHYLNETTGLSNPTSEELARWIFNRLRPFLPLLVEVVIEETCTSRCCYRPAE